VHPAVGLLSRLVPGKKGEVFVFWLFCLWRFLFKQGSKGKTVPPSRSSG
jgi:hypothetical protein